MRTKMGETWNDIPISHTTSEGYVYLRLPDHPLASRDGLVPRHRFVLYEHRKQRAQDIYFARTACEKCRWLLPWKSTGQGDVSRDIINVDHINGVPGDDRPENLRPLCWWCNVNRQWAEEYAPVWYDRLCRWFGGLHPAVRPDMHRLVEEVIGYDPLAAYRRTKQNAA